MKENPEPTSEKNSQEELAKLNLLKIPRIKKTSDKEFFKGVVKELKTLKKTHESHPEDYAFGLPQTNLKSINSLGTINECVKFLQKLSKPEGKKFLQDYYHLKYDSRYSKLKPTAEELENLHRSVVSEVESNLLTILGYQVEKKEDIEKYDYDHYEKREPVNPQTINNFLNFLEQTNIFDSQTKSLFLDKILKYKITYLPYDYEHKRESQTTKDEWEKISNQKNLLKDSLYSLILEKFPNECRILAEDLINQENVNFQKLTADGYKFEFLINNPEFQKLLLSHKEKLKNHELKDFENYILNIKSGEETLERQRSSIYYNKEQIEERFKLLTRKLELIKDEGIRTKIKEEYTATLEDVREKTDLIWLDLTSGEYKSVFHDNPSKIFSIQNLWEDKDRLLENIKDFGIHSEKIQEKLINFKTYLLSLNSDKNKVTSSAHFQPEEYFNYQDFKNNFLPINPDLFAKNRHALNMLHSINIWADMQIVKDPDYIKEHGFTTVTVKNDKPRNIAKGIVLSEYADPTGEVLKLEQEISPTIIGIIRHASEKRGAFDINLIISKFAPYLNDFDDLKEVVHEHETQQAIEEKLVSDLITHYQHGGEEHGYELDNIVTLLEYRSDIGLSEEFLKSAKLKENALIFIEHKHQWRNIDEIVRTVKIFSESMDLGNDAKIIILTKLINSLVKNSKLVLENVQAIDLIQQYRDRLNLPDDLIKEDATKFVINLLKEKHYKNASDVINVFNLDIMEKIPQELRTEYQLVEKIIRSPSQEVQKLKNQILEQLSTSSNPLKTFEEVEQVFIKNNLPEEGKIFKVFRILYPDEEINHKITSTSSPVLRNYGKRPRELIYRELIFYNDLLKVHILSVNRSMRRYLEILRSGEEILDSVGNDNLDNLDQQQSDQLNYFLNRLETLYLSSALGKTNFRAVDLQNQGSSPSERLNKLKSDLKVREGQNITERISEMFLKPLGYESIDDVLQTMNYARIEADKRGREIYNKSINRPLKLAPGDLLKGVEENYINIILQNGSVCKEFLGSDTKSDSTPLDIDLSRVLEKERDLPFEQIYNNSPSSSGYGDICFIIKNKGQFQETSSKNPAKYQKNKYELFQTLGENHYGIRTGIPTTEIDFMIVRENITKDSRRLENLFLEIAQNGYYVPITNQKGEILFTPQMFDEYRKTFDGLERFYANPFATERTGDNEPLYPEIQTTIAEIKKEETRTRDYSDIIREKIKIVLNENDIQLKDPYDPGIVGAELFDIGSTGRNTNIPGEVIDFDLTLKLDETNFPETKSIANKISNFLRPEKDDSHEELGGYYQLRAIGVEGVGDGKTDIDIGLTRKAQLEIFDSQDAVKEKLNYILENDGEETYYEILANIVLAKKVLKEAHAYKKFEDGGFGGIGVENWILANNGNMVRAFQSFYRNAYENNERIAFADFQKKYKIFDAGINIKFGKRDNYVEILKESGYNNMLNVIEKILREKNLT